MSQESERFNRIRRDIGTLLSVSSGLGDLARDNLIYWLNGTRATRNDYPTGVFERSIVVSNELETQHLGRLKTGILNRLRADTNAMFPSGTGSTVRFLGGNESIHRQRNPLKNSSFEEFYIESSIGFESFLIGADLELAYAFGGITIRSRIQVRLLEADQIHPENSRIRIERWFCKVFDKYDWNIGNHAFPFNLLGLHVSDDDMKFYSDHSGSYGRHRGEDYKILSREWTHHSPHNFTTVESLNSYLSRINITSIG